MITEFHATLVEQPRAGIYRTTMQEYIAIRAVSRSRLTLLEQTPAHYAQADVDDEDLTREHFAVGEAVHCAILEPERVGQLVEVSGGEFTRRQKAWPDMARHAASRGHLLLTPDEARMVSEVASAVRRSPWAPIALASPHRELTAIWQDTETLIWCKARIDLLDLGHTPFALDLKTTADASPRRFAYSCRDYGYTLQAGMYMEALNILLPGRIKGFFVLVVEKEAPYRVEFYDMAKHVTHGRSLFRYHMDTLADCIRSGQWPNSHRRPSASITIPELPLL